MLLQLDTDWDFGSCITTNNKYYCSIIEVEYPFFDVEFDVEYHFLCHKIICIFLFAFMASAKVMWWNLFVTP